MKAGWEIKTLNQIAENLDNKRVPITKLARTEGQYPYYGASGIVDYVASYIFEGDTLLISEDGANLLARSTPIAFPATGRYWVNNHAHIIKFDNLITQRFVELFFESIPLDDYITGAAQPKLNQKALNSIPIPVPPLSEQQRIVSILDQAFESIAKARANAEQNLKNARALFESHLQSVFTQRGEEWEVKTLSEVCEIKPPKNEAKKILNNSDLVSFAPMEDLGINQKYLNTIKQRALEDVAGSYTYFAEGDVLLAKITPCFENGKLGIAKNLTNGIGFGSSEYIVFRPNKSLSNEFLYYFLSRKYFIEEGAQRMSGAVGHKRVSKEFIESYKIAFPSIDKQIELIKKTDALANESQRLEALYQRKIACLDDLKKSLLQQAFAGEL